MVMNDALIEGFLSQMLEKKAISFKRPVLSHAIGGAIIGGGVGAAIPQDKENNHRLRNALVGATAGGAAGGVAKYLLNKRREGMIRKQFPTMRGRPEPDTENIVEKIWDRYSRPIERIRGDAVIAKTRRTDNLWDKKSRIRNRLWSGELQKRTGRSERLDNAFYREADKAQGEFIRSVEPAIKKKVKMKGLIRDAYKQQGNYKEYKKLRDAQYGIL